MGKADSWGDECAPKLQVNYNLAMPGLSACYLCLANFANSGSFEFVEMRMVHTGKQLFYMELRVTNRSTLGFTFIVKWVIIMEESW